MKFSVTISYNGHARSADDNVKILRDAGVDVLRPRSQEHPFYSFELDEGDPRADLARLALQAIGQTYLETRTAKYSRQNLIQSSLLEIVVRKPPKGSPQERTDYDLGPACSLCGTGAVQISPLRFLESELPRRSLVLKTYTGEIILSDKVVRNIMELTGPVSALRQVKSAKTGQSLGWWQIIPTLCLPRLTPQTKGLVRENPCPRCGRDGYFGTAREPFQPVYNTFDFADLQAWPRAEHKEPPDFAYTHEHLGNSFSNAKKDPGRHVVYAQPLIMVSNRVMRLFLDHNVRDVDFIPVVVLGVSTTTRDALE